MRETVFAGGRSVQKVAVIITDGESNIDQASTLTEAKLLRDVSWEYVNDLTLPHTHTHTHKLKLTRITRTEQ